MIFSTICSKCKIPKGATINLSNQTTIAKNDYGDDIWVPTGDLITVYDPKFLRKVKFIEQHKVVDATPPYNVIVERHCIFDNNAYYPYMLKVFSPKSYKADIILFPDHISCIKEIYFDGAQKEHQSMAEHYLYRQMYNHPYELYKSEFEEFISKHSPVFKGISIDSENSFWTWEDYLNEYVECLQNIKAYPYREHSLLPIVVPSIVGYGIIDLTTSLYNVEPIPKHHISLHTKRGNAINTEYTPFQIDKDVECCYDMNFIPDTNMYRVYKILMETPVTEIDVWFYKRKSDIKQSIARYPSSITKASFYNIIQYIHQLLDNELRYKLSVPVDIRMVRTFDDEAIFQLYKNGKMCKQWYWDLSLSALCSNSLIVWPIG